MSKRLVLAALAGLIIAAAAASQGVAQAAEDADGDGVTDTADRCPTTPGPPTALGCPDSDGDGVADVDDVCPTASSLQGPDLNHDGCLEPISVLNFRYRFVAGKTGLRLTLLRLDVITGLDQIGARWRCRGAGCGGRIRKKGRSLVFRVTRRRLRPGTRLKIETRNSFGGGALECFALRVRRKGAPKVTARRALTLGVPAIRC
jgi:Thrombospondin type 3 repeat